MATADRPPSFRTKSKPATPSSTAPSLLETFQRFWAKSYAGDYFGLAALLAAYIVIALIGEPFHRHFRLNDPRLQFPHAEVERVDVFMLFLYAAVIPAALLAIWTIFLKPPIHKAHVTLLGLATSIILTTFLTDVLKDAIGRPRPDLIARCNPDADAPKDVLVTIQVCKESRHHVLHDGWRSFPSGHSSFAFAGLGYVALFLASQTKALTPRASLLVILICLLPLLAAALIAISRLEDYRHDFADVIAGSLLGLSVTYLNWRRYYPSLLSGGCDEPHSAPGSRRGSPSGFLRVRDEEEAQGMVEAGRYGMVDEEGFGREGVR
ncbi:putative diacylglycerol pyrophosphate phosphatase 1 [Teratosphaeria destructans]|uniref:Diacylglycerol pyrophosphate phosphatase 1 n=1 Tax=Teratosphaeria destructans TaxID=418781 RepID=A0A9W7SX74_9PEZI|nr:putative diacylglycerol pyrophosphate phosphatase 1 [Teratosphaeria destructans]